MLLNCGGREDLRVSWTAIQSWRKSTLHIIGRTDGEAEAPILWPPDAKSWFTGKDPDAGIDWGQEEKTEDEIVGWHHWFDGHEFEQSPGDGIPGQGCLVWCVGAVCGVTKRKTGLSNQTTTTTTKQMSDVQMFAGPCRAMGPREILTNRC